MGENVIKYGKNAKSKHENDAHSNTSFKEELPVGIHEKIAKCMQHTKFHVLIIALVMSDLILVMVELVISEYVSTGKCSGQMSHETVERFEILEAVLGHVSFSILCAFVVEIIIRIWAIGIITFFTNWFSIIDFCVILGSFVLEIIFEYAKVTGSGSNSKALILLRMLRIIRMLHAVAHGIEMMAHKKIERLQEAKEEVEEELSHLMEKVENLTLKLEEERFRRIQSMTNPESSGRNALQSLTR